MCGMNRVTKLFMKHIKGIRRFGKDNALTRFGTMGAIIGISG